ncbi:GNAT family N-acetyltransferase [Amycolatopsis rhizosphaerae]|uniref:GNAT family N-acetyltransferase n=1 Tax=Amycolatopsis rhizosphaerae TaxID=2053003 RepID=A0A558D8P9_9PSEU|nr:GNAT family N-acetyltransferase [Amycolatopsis rhizosphaerae]TVT57412.1 GNAT family N-acetyltransferase [Amycolatopsis rhizosphaerae]
MEIRPGGESDYTTVLSWFDEAVEWLVARGSEGQWGTEPWTGNPEREKRVREFVGGGGLYIGEADGIPVGALVLGERLPYTPPVDEPELYVVLLLTSRRRKGHGVGSALLAFAKEEATRRGVGLLRVDCWSGGDGKLVEYYRSQGFTPTVEVPVRDTSVQVFEYRL